MLGRFNVNKTEEELYDDFCRDFTGEENAVLKEEETYLDTISLDLYEWPSVTDYLLDKIRSIKTTTDNIDSRVKKKVKQKDDKKPLRIDYSACLNEEQYLAVISINSPLLVIAGAGSGKTRTLVYRVAYLLENGISPSEILLLTFTRKAAGEMLKRASELLDSSESENIRSGTFHSIANYLLRKYSNVLGISSAFTIVDTVDSADIIDLVRREMRFEKKSKAFPRKGSIQKIISKSRNTNRTIKRLCAGRKSLEPFTKDIELIDDGFKKYKAANNLYDYDDLLDVLCKFLRENSAFRNIVQDTFRYIMVDEFQDTNIVQKEIVDLIAEKYRNIMIVGDDSQSVYSFRGANYENILKFPEVYKDCNVVKIEQNYRSNQGILNFSNDIIKNAAMGYKKRLVSNNNRLIKPRVQRFYNSEAEAEYIVSKIIDINSSGIPLEEIAVLYRSSVHGNNIQLELLKRSIPYVVFGGIRFNERRHIKDIISYLRIIQNPLDAVAWNRILNLIAGIGSVTAGKIIKHLKQSDSDFCIEGFSSNKFFGELSLLNDTFKKASHEDVEVEDKIAVLIEYYTDIIRKVDNDYEKRIHDVGILKDIAKKYTSLEKFLSDFALNPPSDKFQDNSVPIITKIKDKPLVLSTVHSSKGLEWDTVFIPSLLDGCFPQSRASIELETLEEERRLFYVACTRAKESLFLTMPSFSYLHDTLATLPSRFLLEVRRENFEYIH